MFLARMQVRGDIRHLVWAEECTLRFIRRIIAIPRSRPRCARGSIIRRLGIAGFTLLEMFIVIEIIGFLATMVLANFYKSKKAAEVAVTVQNVKNIQTALASYFVAKSEYPATLNTIWLQFYNGRVAEEVAYIGGAPAGDQGEWNFIHSNSPDIRFAGISGQEYALKSTKNLLPYASFVYGDAATSAKIVH